MPSSHSTDIAVVIPARYGSTRFPGKPLVRASGKYLIEHVVEQARRSRRAGVVVVATDDVRILEAVRGFGAVAVMTKETHQSGTDRIAEVMRRPEYAHVRTIVNVQGDEPEIEPELIDRLIEGISAEGGAEGATMATVSAPFGSWGEVQNPNLVKVVVDGRRRALYFSRSVIPFDRDRHMEGATGAGSLSGSLYRKHLGIYAYTREALLTLAEAPVCELERLEKLEQLRALYLGIRIFVAETDRAPHGIDTPEDYAAFLRRRQMGQAQQ